MEEGLGGDWGEDWTKVTWTIKPCSVSGDCSDGVESKRQSKSNSKVSGLLDREREPDVEQTTV